MKNKYIVPERIYHNNRVRSNIYYKGQNVRIFLPRLAASVTKNQLGNFAAEVLDGKLSLPFTRKPSLDHWDILSITDCYGTVEHHGLITINPESAAHWFIRQARGKVLGNKRVLLREHFDRKNDSSHFPQEDDRRNSYTSTKIHWDKY